MIFHIITLFPDSFSYLDESILNRAQKNGKIKIKFYNPRDFVPRRGSGQATKHPTVDDRSYGGGPGMVMKAGPILKAVANAIGRKKSVKIIIFSPSGKQFDNAYALKLAKNYKNVVFIAGRYEGVDERVVKALRQAPARGEARQGRQGKPSVEKVSLGPYVLTGGELPAMVVIDAVARHIKGVLGKGESLEENRVASPEVYTRPEVLEHKGKKYRVPKVLLSGDHKKIEEWRWKRKR